MCLFVLIILASSLIIAPVKVQAVSSYTTASCTLGDVNGDGFIDSSDENLVVDIVMGITTPTLAADLDGDGIVSPADVAQMNANASQGINNPLIISPVSCDLPTAAVTYSKDGGLTYNSSITVSGGDTLNIKATFSKALSATEFVYLSVDNSLVDNKAMVAISPTEFSYDLTVPTGNINATVSIIKYFGSFDDNIILTSGSTFDIIDSVVFSSFVPGACTLGDVNGDGLLDGQDTSLVMDIMAGIATPTLAADLDGDGIVSPADVAKIKSNIAQGAASPLITNPVSCDLPTAAITYSKDAGVSYNSSTTVKNGDTLNIKATFSKALAANEFVYLYVDNGLVNDKAMVKISPTEFSYDLAVPTGNINPATVSIRKVFGSFNNAIVLTNGSIFIIKNSAPPPVSSGGGSYLNYCENIVYSDWSSCANDQQTRTVISALPISCVFTTAQQADLQRTCANGQGQGQGTLGEGQGQGQVLGEKIVDPRELQLTQIFDDAHYIWPGDMDLLLGYMNVNRDLALEQSMNSKYGSILGSNVKMALVGLESSNAAAVTNFLAYGTKTTLKLGAGERAGVLNSYKAAFGQLPKTEENWRDAIKIANGRWPSQVSAAAEKLANVNFKIVYKRNANMANANDNAAVTTMAYGLRPLPRNLDSEKTAIKSFKGIFGYYPVKATAWDVVRAIAYSGAKR